MYALPNKIVYFHAPDASRCTLESIKDSDIIFEIDLSYAHSNFNEYISKGTPYIGHPEEFYTIMKKPFPKDNVSFDEFINFAINHPSIKILIDIKDKDAFPYLEKLVNSIGSDRCIVHAFIKNWTQIPNNISKEPHWYKEDIDLFILDELLTRLNVALIANCRAFNNKHVEDKNLLDLMINDAKKCQSIISLGLYLQNADIPKTNFLKILYKAGYYVWVNGNLRNIQEHIKNFKYIAMIDDFMKIKNN